MPVKEAGRCISSHSRSVVFGTIADISDRISAEHVLRESRRRLEKTLRHAPDGRWVSVNRALFDARELAKVSFEAIGEGVIRVDEQGRIMRLNASACVLLDTQRDQAIGSFFSAETVVRLIEQEGASCRFLCCHTP